MAEKVSQRIEDRLDEFYALQRIGLFEQDEIRDVITKTKDFEYRLQRKIKCKEDYANYIAYELALLESVAYRRKKFQITESKQDIEYSIARRVNRVFQEFLSRFKDDLEIYFQYIKFCQGVNFDYEVSKIIATLLQFHGDKPRSWQLASKWESYKGNIENSRNYLLKGIVRHPKCDFLYLDLFKAELTLACKSDDEEKEKFLKRAEIVWKNGFKETGDVTLLFEICNWCLKCDVASSIIDNVKEEIWIHRNEKDVLPYIAMKELEGYNWSQIEDFENKEVKFSKELNNFITVFEEALSRFPDEKLFTQYLHKLISLNGNLCSDLEKTIAVKQAWMLGYDQKLLSCDMYTFMIDILNVENSFVPMDITEIVNAALDKFPTSLMIWKEKLSLNKDNEKQILSLAESATKVLKKEDALQLWNITLDHIKSAENLKNLYRKIHACESILILMLKPKLLQKMYDHHGLKAARELYEEFIRTPPMQVDVHRTMINIEMAQDNINVKNVRKCYECAVQHHGRNDVLLWLDYMKFETESGNTSSAPAVYRRAIDVLNKKLVQEFIKADVLNKVNSS